MNRNSISLSLLLLLTCSTTIPLRTARALELRWASGSSNIVVTASRRCTLIVRSSPGGDGLPHEWQLSWALADTNPLRITEGQSTVGIADVCSIGRGIAPAAFASRTDTAIFCTSSPRATVARYVVDLDARSVARLKLVPTESDAVEEGSPLLEVTVNGGGGLRYPPLPLQVNGSQSNELWTVAVAGIDLDRVRSVRYGAGFGLQSLDIVHQSSTGLVAQGVLAQAPDGSYLELTDDQGFVGTINIPEAISPAPWARDRFLVRFNSGEVEPEEDQAGGMTARLKYRSRRLLDSLVAIGVTRLERLLPSFKHHDVNSFNQLGEPILLQDLADLYVAYVNPGQDIRAAARRVAASSGVRYACPDYILRATTPPPNDALFGDQWWLYNPPGMQPCGFPGVPNRDIDALHAWDYETGASNVRVGVLDTGILAAHPDLSPRVVLDTSFVGDGLGGSDNSRDTVPQWPESCLRPPGTLKVLQELLEESRFGLQQCVWTTTAAHPQ